MATFLSFVPHALLSIVTSTIVAVSVHVPFVMNALMHTPPSAPHTAETAMATAQAITTEMKPTPEMMRTTGKRLPNAAGTVIAITNSNEEGKIATFLIDVKGNQISKLFAGDAQQWTPNQSKLILFVPSDLSPDGNRHIYFLHADGYFEDPQLPAGTYAASVSPKGDIAFVTEHAKGTDAGDIYVRDTTGKDYLIMASTKNIFSDLAWSADGKLLSYTQSDLAGNDRQRGVLSAGAFIPSNSKATIIVPDGTSRYYDTLTKEQVQELLQTCQIKDGIRAFAGTFVTLKDGTSRLVTGGLGYQEFRAMASSSAATCRFRPSMGIE